MGVETEESAREETIRIVIREAALQKSREEEDTFFSITQQAVLASATVLAFLGLPLVAVWVL